MRYLFAILFCVSAYGFPVGFNEPVVGGTNLVAWWTFNENAGAIANDVAGRYVAYGTNSPVWMSGIAGSSFDSSRTLSSYFKSTFSNGTFTAGTVTWWQNPTSAWNSAIARGLWGQEIDAVPSQFIAQIAADNKWYVGWFYNSLERRVIVTGSTANWKTNEWHFYAYTWGTNGVFYMDCIPIGTNTSSVSATNFNVSFNLGGVNASGVNRSFGGRLDDVRIYRTNLSLVDLTNLYNGGYSSQH